MESPGGEETAFNVQIQRLADHPKPITPEQAGVLRSSCITPKQTSEGKVVVPSQRRDLPYSTAIYSKEMVDAKVQTSLFLFKARPRRGRL